MMLHACDTPRLRLLRAQTMSGLLVGVKTSSRSANHGTIRKGRHRCPSGRPRRGLPDVSRAGFTRPTRHPAVQGSVPLGGPQFMDIGTAIRAPVPFIGGPVRAGFRQADHGGLGRGGQMCSGTAAP
jgi:hypothetical protein